MQELRALIAPTTHEAGCWTAPDPGRISLREIMEGLMRANPQHWKKHYEAPPGQLRLPLHFNYADRIRYYWTQPVAQTHWAQALIRTEVQEALLPYFAGWQGQP